MSMTLWLCFSGEQESKNLGFLGRFFRCDSAKKSQVVMAKQLQYSVSIKRVQYTD